MVGSKKFFDLGYPSLTNGWVATLGPSQELKFDPHTGKEDFTDQRRVGQFIETWRPGQEWLPQPICLHFEDLGRKLRRADRIFHNGVGPFISEEAVSVMRPLLEREGHVLPLKVINSCENFYLWWVPWVENSVDLGLSQKFPNGRSVKQYAFNESKVVGLTAFRPHYEEMYNPDAQGKVLVSEEFKQEWLSAGLTGIEFKPT
ncbi:hypothetical protein [Gymnodinialimonas sp.]